MLKTYFFKNNDTTERWQQMTFSFSSVNNHQNKEEKDITHTSSSVSTPQVEKNVLNLDFCYISHPQQSQSYNKLDKVNSSDINTSIKVIYPSQKQYTPDTPKENSQPVLYENESQTDTQISVPSIHKPSLDSNPYTSVEILALQKNYYMIREVSDILDISTSHIRYLDKNFKRLNPKKNKHGIRYFSPTDIRMLYLIILLQKNYHMTIKECQAYIKKNINLIKSYFSNIEKLFELKKGIEKTLNH